MILALILAVPILAGLACFFYAVSWLEKHDFKEEGRAW